MSKESVPGTTTLYKELNQFFKNRGNTSDIEKAKQNDNT